MISYMSQQATTIEQLRKDNEERKARDASQQKTDDNTPIIGSRLMLTQGPVTAQPTGYGHTNGITPQATGFPRAF
jgi:clathrin heavy chain